MIALAKVIAGLLASSVAIASESINNAAYAMTSVLTLAGSRLAGKYPDAKHSRLSALRRRSPHLDTAQDL